MKLFLISLLMIFIFTVVGATEVANTAPKTVVDEYRIAYIYSEDYKSFYRKGADRQIERAVTDMLFNKKVLLKTYFLNANADNADPANLLNSFNDIGGRVEIFNPDAIVTFGPEAYRLFISKFTWFNGKVANLRISVLDEEYKLEKPKNTLLTIHEDGIQKVLTYLHNNGTATPIFYVIRDISPRSYKIFNNLRSILAKEDILFKVVNIEVSNVQELKQAMFELYAKERGIIVPLFRTLPDYDTNKVLDWENIIKYIVTNNSKNLELIIGDDGSSLGAAISIMSNRDRCARPKVQRYDYLRLFFIDEDKLDIGGTYYVEPFIIVNKQRVAGLVYNNLFKDLSLVECLR